GLFVLGNRRRRARVAFRSPCRGRAGAAVHAEAEPAHDLLAARILEERVLVRLLRARAERAHGKGAGHGEEGTFFAEGVSHGVLSLTALLCLGRLVEWHSERVGACRSV